MDISRQDWQLLSEYMDDELSAKEKARLERRLEREDNLQKTLQKLRRTRRILRATPQLSAPKNFTLTPEMIGRRKEQASLFPVFRLATALVSFLLVAMLVLDFSGLILPQGAIQPAAPAMEQEALEMSREESGKAVGEPEREQPQEDALAEGVEEELAEEEAEKNMEALSASQETETPTWTPTPPSPSATTLPPMPDTATERGLGRWSLIRIVEVILASLVVLFAAGMFLTLRDDTDVG